MTPTREFLVLLRLIASVSVVALLAASPEAAVPKKILIVHSFGRDFAPYNPTGQAFRTRLTELLKQPVVFHEVSLDVERGELEDERPLVEYLLRRTHDTRPDLVVAIANPAALFCMRHREELFPDRSLLVTGVDKRRLTDLKLQDGDGVVTVDLDFPGVARSMLAIRPETTTVALVVGATRLERYWAEQIQRDLAPLANRLRLMPLTDLTLDEVRKRVADLPPHSAVFYYMFAVGADGLQYEDEQALTAIRESTNSPIFGSFASQLGNGIVGGGLIDMALFGRESAPMAVRMLAGESGGHRHVATQPPTFDWRELQRWSIDENLLPPDSVIRFRQQSVWDQYKLRILVGALILVLQSIFITGLVVQRARGRRTEAALRQSLEQNRGLAGRLINAQEEERSRIARDLHDDASQQLAGVGIMLSGLKRQLGQPGSQVEVRRTVKVLEERTTLLADSIRNISHQLHPAVLHHAGLASTLQRLGADIEQNHELKVSISGGNDLEALSPDVALCLYRVAQETLTNAVRHGRAQRILIQLSATNGAVELKIEDDGVGFVPSERTRNGLGLRSIDERVRLVRGTLKLESQPGRGTRLIVSIPRAQSTERGEAPQPTSGRGAELT